MQIRHFSGPCTNSISWDMPSCEKSCPYLDVALDAFGPGRIVAGSGWPVSTCAADYATTMGPLRTRSARLGETERAAFLGGNCICFHGIEEQSA
jgi:L-fuconolactonase